MSELLLIDDDQELCELLSSWLSQEGFHVRACHDGRSARRALAETSPAAVVLDVMLPDGSGLELLRRIRQRREVPALALSGFGMDEDLERSRNAGFSDHLTKPVSIDQLQAAIAQLDEQLG